ncbi:hypothetical protein ACO0M4_30030 [Streptomyces sp. RGM 3693]|uniref:hypothetical protein n=1 Tax=Streptomyces sp. RGM 3693 TaxID=3413284 RepID=UPI003D29FAC2
MRIASLPVSTVATATATLSTDGNNNSCTSDDTSFTATECQPRQPNEERNLL